MRVGVNRQWPGCALALNALVAAWGLEEQIDMA